MEPNNMAIAFTVWAAVVALIGGGIVWELSRLRDQVSDVADKLAKMAVDFEHRLTAVEQDIRRCAVFARDL